LSEQELFNNVGSADTEFLVEDTYNSGDVNVSLGFAVSSANFSGKTLTRIKLYGGSTGIGWGTVRMWVATARSFAPNPNDGVTISARTYSTNTHDIQDVHTGSYEFTFSGVTLPSDSVLVFGLEIINGGSSYNIVFGQSGVNTGAYPLYEGDVTSIPSTLGAEVYNFQPGCIIYGTVSTAYSVTYNGNGNTGGSAPTDPNSPYLNTSTVTVLGNTGNLTKTNHTFIGWSTNSNATVAQYTQGSTFTIDSNTVLYAVWSPPLSVTYNGNGNSAGAAPTDSNSPYQYGSTVTVLGNTGGLWLTGFNFAGWSTDPLDLWPTLAPGDTFTITENTTLYAIWLYGGPPVGNLYSVNYNGNGHTSGYPPTDWTYPAGATVTVLGKNTLAKTGYTFLGWATASNAPSVNRMPGSTFDMPSNNITLYAVWSSSGGGGGNIIVVPYSGRYVGSSGSKQISVVHTGVSPIMQVATNMPNDTDSSAVIENLIIDGLNLSNNATGILLENVCGCLIRNVTIMNCEVGIRVKLTGDNGSFSRDNRFEHIRMINVKTGILFEGTSSAKDFSYTTIEDVGISLADNSTDTGIKVGNGNTNANLYSAFIKANIWLNGSNGKGLEVNGQLKGSLVNLAVSESAQNNTGKCIVLNAGANISTNQSFLLTVLGVTNNITNNAGTYSGIKIVP
jgi:uncharacterized repeat protein (TIGR02543 family)